MEWYLVMSVTGTRQGWMTGKAHQGLVRSCCREGTGVKGQEGGSPHNKAGRGAWQADELPLPMTSGGNA
ncbi:hypothetical protein HaLaN_13805, partial [Haematococcus lacustris]